MKNVKKAIIPAAGLGTRFLPITKSIPKEMLPIVDKPAIQYIVEEAVLAGIEDIIIVTGRNKRAIEDHFDRNIELEINLAKKQKNDLLSKIERIPKLANIHYMRQYEPLGLGHAIWCARKFIGNEPFAVLLGDVVSNSQNPCLAQLHHVYKTKKTSVIAVEEVAWSETNKYGIIKGSKMGEKLYSVESMVEKPSKNPPSNLAIAGRYILEPDVFEILEKTKAGAGGEVQLTDALQTLTQLKSLLAYLYTDDLFDVGDKVGFIKANIELACKDEQLKQKLKLYLETFHNFK